MFLVDLPGGMPPRSGTKESFFLSRDTICCTTIYSYIIMIRELNGDYKRAHTPIERLQWTKRRSHYAKLQKRHIVFLHAFGIFSSHVLSIFLSSPYVCLQDLFFSRCFDDDLKPSSSHSFVRLPLIPRQLSCVVNPHFTLSVSVTNVEELIERMWNDGSIKWEDKLSRGAGEDDWIGIHKN